jgi:hypothetical protein
MTKTNELTIDQQKELLDILKARFEKNMNRHIGLNWTTILAKLESFPEKLWSLNEMEKTGGQPDVVKFDDKSTEFVFCDCSPESPIGRRNLCYDNEAMDARKKYKPADSAINMAKNMGIEVLDEEQYRKLQELKKPASPTGGFDTKTSSWITTPPEIRKLGGALFCDRRYNHIFTYHNGADSYYGGRGFRGMIIV